MLYLLKKTRWVVFAISINLVFITVFKLNTMKYNSVVSLTSLPDSYKDFPIFEHVSEFLLQIHSPLTSVRILELHML